MEIIAFMATWRHLKKRIGKLLLLLCLEKQEHHINKYAQEI